MAGDESRRIERKRILVCRAPTVGEVLRLFAERMENRKRD